MSGLNNEKSVTVDENWRIEGVYPEDGWTYAACDLETDINQWVETEEKRLRNWWGEAWAQDEAANDLNGAALRDAYNAAHVPGTLIAMLHWPLPLPLPSRIRVELASGSPVTVQAWQDAGFDVDEWSGSALGPGLKCIAARDEVIDGVALHLSTAAYVFANQDGGVMVTVESGTREVFDLTLAKMPAILSTLTLYLPGGVRFFASDVKGMTRNAMDEWEKVTDA
jgi:hypothetical protein